MDLKKYLEDCRQTVEEALARHLDRPAVSTRLAEAMKYSLMAGGKRVRPALAIAACETVGGTVEDVLPAACALEMIHTYSLVHDDLPAMDDDDLRRGRPTNHKKFGEAVAILAGDGLLTEAFFSVADPTWNIPADRKIDIAGIIAEGAGANGMVGGQALDLEHEGRKVDEKTLENIHRHKTGKLFRASVLAGGRAGGATGKALDSLDTYAKAIGLAFQIADDLLDVTSTTEKLGKGADKDKDKNKATYPAVLGVVLSKKRAEDLLEQAINALKPFGEKAQPLSGIARFIVERKS